MNDDVNKCFKCGHLNNQVPEDIAGYYEFKCVNCGTLNAIHVTPAWEAELTLSKKVILRLVNKTVNIEQLKLIRELFPKLNEISIVNLKKELDLSSEYQFGIFNAKEAELIVCAGLKEGLIIDVTEVD